MAHPIPSPRLRLLAPLLLILLPAGLAGAHVLAQSPDDLLREGVRHHDAGDYEDAIAAFRRVLEIEPGHPMALYELANTYAATGQYEKCVAAADGALGGDVPAGLGGPLQSAAGTCLSAAGKAGEAIERFEEGLRRYPDDPKLHYNVAITLTGQGELRRAAEHLEQVIRLQPDYASPYVALAEILRREGRRMQSLLLFVRFVSLAPNDPRSGSAAQSVVALLAQGIEEGEDGGIEINLYESELPEGDPWRTYDLTVVLGGAVLQTEEQRAKSEAQRHVDVLVKLLCILEESGPPEGAADTVVWQRAAEPLVSLQAEGRFQALAFLLALRGGLDGAQEWVEAHPEEMKALERALFGG